MEKVIIAPAVPEDIDSVYAIEIEEPSPWKRNFFTAELSIESPDFYIAKIDGDTVGFIIVRPIPGQTEILKIAVKREFRRRGIGTMLYRNAVSDHFDKEPVEIFLEVRKQNNDAIGFYQNLGFRSAGTRKNYYEGDDAIIMRRSTHNEI